MIATLAACGLAATTVVNLAGWWSASRRVATLQRQVDAYCAEDWHSAEEMVEFAGRCAWHDFVTTDEVPPMVEDHLVDNFRAGFAAEQAVEDAICAKLAAGWNGAMGRAAE